MNFFNELNTFAGQNLTTAQVSDLRSYWGRAEEASTAYGVADATAQGLTTNHGWLALYQVTEFYRLDNANHIVDYWSRAVGDHYGVGGFMRDSDAWALDPRNRAFPVGAGHEVYYGAQIVGGIQDVVGGAWNCVTFWGGNCLH
jgi:hypothetical protein